MKLVMRRRDLLIGAGAAALALPAIAQNAKTRVLRFVPLANLTALDPILTAGELILRRGGDFDRFAPFWSSRRHGGLPKADMPFPETFTALRP